MNLSIGLVRCRVLFVLSLATLCTATAQTPSSESDRPTRQQLAESLAAWLALEAPAWAADPESTEAFRPRYFDQVQLRTESDRLDRARQRYSVRVRPRLPHLRKAEREVQLAQRMQLTPRPQEATAAARGDALMELFGMAALQRELVHIDSMLAVESSLIRVSRARLVEEDYDVERLLDEEDDYAETLARREVLGQLLASRLPPLPLERIISSEAIASKMDSLFAQEPTVWSAERSASALALIDAETALEKAENWAIINFVQLDYRSDLLPGKERYSIGGGIDLPQPNSRNRDLDELQIERAAEQQRLALEREEAQRAHVESFRELQTLFLELAAAQKSAQSRIARRTQLRAVLVTDATTRPDALLRIERRDLQDRGDVLDLELEIADRYAEWLAESIELDAASLADWVLID